jgi:hypothetical protein
MTLQSFFQIPLVRLGVHLVIVIGFILSIWQFYTAWDMDQRISKEQQILDILIQENSDARNERDYFTSELYQEKYAKQENYKVRGEEVIDTSVIEPSSESEVGNYISPVVNEEKSNPVKWLEYLFGRQRQ